MPQLEKIAERKTIDESEFVKEGYEQVYEHYLTAFTEREKRYDLPPVDLFIDQTKKLEAPKVLQLGCGDGIPIGARFIANNLEYHAVEYSEKMHALAQKNLKSHADQIHQGEMVAFCKTLPDASFSGVASFFAIHHLTPPQQLQLFMQVQRILVKDGIFLFNTKQELNGIDETFQGEQKRWGIVQNFFGKPTYQAFMTAEWYINTLQLLGFELISKYVGENVFANKIQHPVYMVFRRKAVLTEQKKA